mgnify:CR=1 FL=1|tara:strand:+ start:536 stop:748 length:213 start_codon:yes stop_codon:yes gene_type:complete
MREYDITWKGLVFTVWGNYEAEVERDYDHIGSSERFNIWMIHLGDACVDFMLNDKTVKELEEEILNTYYR